VLIVTSRHDPVENDRVLAPIVTMLREITGLADPIAPSTRIEDLHLDSLEIAELAARLRTAYAVDLPAHLATLDINQLIDLTVADIAALAPRQASEPHAGRPR
jgi:acyl carrier protein